jgi:hypothetical protein
VVQKAVHAALERLLLPLVRVLLRYGVTFGTFEDIAKRVYVRMALQEFRIPGRKPTISRAAIITGLSRKEILRVQRLPPLGDAELSESYNRAIRVISGWVRDSDFAGPDGQPAALPFAGNPRSFSELVRRYSGDVPPRAILDELLRVGSLAQDEDGTIRLLSRAYVPAQGDAEKIFILGSDVADLIATIDHNLQVPARQSRLQLKVSYDNLPAEPLARFRKLSVKESRKLLESFDRELSAADRDTHPEAKGTGRHRAGVAIYYFEEDLSDREPEEDLSAAEPEE